MVGRLQEKIARASYGGNIAGAQAAQQLRVKVSVGAICKRERDFGVIEGGLERPRHLANGVARIFVHTRKDVRRTSNRANAIGHGNPRHFERNVEVCGPIVNTRQQMTMQVDHFHTKTWLAAATVCKSSRAKSPARDVNQPSPAET